MLEHNLGVKTSSKWFTSWNLYKPLNNWKTPTPLLLPLKSSDETFCHPSKVPLRYWPFQGNSVFKLTCVSYYATYLFCYFVPTVQQLTPFFAKVLFSILLWMKGSKASEIFLFTLYCWHSVLDCIRHVLSWSKGSDGSCSPVVFFKSESPLYLFEFKKSVPPPHSSFTKHSACDWCAIKDIQRLISCVTRCCSVTHKQSYWK